MRVRCSATDCCNDILQRKRFFEKLKDVRNTRIDAQILRGKSGDQHGLHRRIDKPESFRNRQPVNVILQHPVGDENIGTYDASDVDRFAAA